MTPIGRRNCLDSKDIVYAAPEPHFGGQLLWLSYSFPNRNSTCCKHTRPELEKKVQHPSCNVAVVRDTLLRRRARDFCVSHYYHICPHNINVILAIVAQPVFEPNRAEVAVFGDGEVRKEA